MEIEIKEEMICSGDDEPCPRKYQHGNFEDIYKFLTTREYPKGLTKAHKANFRRQCKPYVIEDNKLMYLKKDREGQSLKTRVLLDEDEIQSTIRTIHEGLEDNAQVHSMSGHRGKPATISIIRSRFFWRDITKDVTTYFSSCEACRKAYPQLNINSTADNRSVVRK